MGGWVCARTCAKRNFMLHCRDIRYTKSRADGRARQQSEAQPQVGMASVRQAGGLSAGADREPEPRPKRQM